MDPTTLAWNVNNTVVNGSFNTADLFCITKYKTLNVLTIILAVIGLAGNATVLWLLGFHMHRNAFSVYVLNLAGADFLYLCTQIVHSLEYILQLDYPYFYYLPIALVFAYLAGLCLTAAISTERCLSVMWPIWYRCQRPRHTSAIMCALLWAFCLLLSLLLGGGFGLLSGHYDYSFCRTCNFITTTFMIVLSVVPSVSSQALLVKIICGSQRIPVTRLYMTVALTVVVFIVFGLPLGILGFILPWITDFKTIVSDTVYHIINFLSCVNSCANPVIYFLVGSIRHRRLQRQTLKQLLQRAMQDTPEEESGERGPSQVWETGHSLVQ